MSWEQFCKLNNIGLRFQQAHIGQCKIKQEIIDIGIDWCQKPISLVLHGLAGRGKTHFSYCLIREAIRIYGMHQMKWIKSKTLDDKMLKAYNLYGDTSYTIKEYAEEPLLFIDDFGVERSGERTERDYYELIDTRWENMRPTIISTNLDETQIEKMYGPRVHSRLKDSKWIHFDGPDLRGVN